MWGRCSPTPGLIFRVGAGVREERPYPKQAALLLSHSGKCDPPNFTYYVKLPSGLNGTRTHS